MFKLLQDRPIIFMVGAMVVMMLLAVPVVWVAQTGILWSADAVEWRETKKKFERCLRDRELCMDALVTTSTGVSMIRDCNKTCRQYEFKYAELGQQMRYVEQTRSKQIQPVIAFRGEPHWDALKAAYDWRYEKPHEKPLPTTPPAEAVPETPPAKALRQKSVQKKKK